jgi:hypothetical protein
MTVATVDAKLTCVMSMAELNGLNLGEAHLGDVLRAVDRHDAEYPANR